VSRRLVAFLRGINVGGHTASMDTLRAPFEKQGLENVQTFIASGNVVFETSARDLAGLERKLERQLHTALGYEVRTFIRSAHEVAVVASQPAFPVTRTRGVKGYYVGFLTVPPPTPAVKALLALRSPNDELQVRGREVYWRSTAGVSGSKLSYAVFERTLGGPATFRGMNTITRLVAKYGLGTES
jgi:uncharacterized protein (DUF1697 family)